MLCAMFLRKDFTVRMRGGGVGVVVVVVDEELPDL